MMKEVAVYEAKIRLSELISAAESGESTVITRRGKPVARIVAATVPNASAADDPHKRSVEAMAALRQHRDATVLGEPVRDAIDDGRD